MKTKVFYFSALLIASTLTMSSCSSDNSEKQSEEKVQSCFYSYNENATTFEFVAYKTNEKKGVPGGFNEIEVTSEMAENPKDVIESISFSLNTASVETKDESRNAKVAEHFFKTINTEKITGKFKSLNDDGKAVVEITMNGISMDVEGDYKLEDAAFSFNASIDVVNWNGMSGIEALNKVCEDLHKGADGVSKLWSEVTLSLSTTLDSDCD